MDDDLAVDLDIETRAWIRDQVRRGQRCSETCDGRGPDWVDRGPNPEDAMPIPCPKCGRRLEVK